MKKNNSQTSTKKLKETKLGRDPKYAIWMNNVAKKLAFEGWIDKDIYEALGICEATGINYKKKYPEFLKALNEGKSNPNKQVEQKLLERALGFTFDSEKIITLSDGAQIGSHWEKVPIKEYVIPDVGAMKEWLWNRDPTRWKNKHDVNVTGKMEYKVIPDEILEDKE